MKNGCSGLLTTVCQKNAFFSKGRQFSRKATADFQLCLCLFLLHLLPIPYPQRTNQIPHGKEEDGECTLGTKKQRTQVFGLELFKVDLANSRRTVTLHLRVSPEELSALAAGSPSKAGMTGTVTADL